MLRVGMQRVALTQGRCQKDWSEVRVRARPLSFGYSLGDRLRRCPRTLRSCWSVLVWSGRVGVIGSLLEIVGPPISTCQD
jgi:hypothetical protein